MIYVFIHTILRGVLHTAEKISAVCITPLRWSPRCVAHRWDDLRDVQHTAEMISAVCIIPLRWSLRCASYRWDDLRDVNQTEETNCTPRRWNQNLLLSLVAFQGTIRWNLFIGEHIYHERNDLKDKNVDLLRKMSDLSGGLHTAEITLWSNISAK